MVWRWTLHRSCIEFCLPRKILFLNLQSLSFQECKFTSLNIMFETSPVSRLVLIWNQTSAVCHCHWCSRGIRPVTNQFRDNWHDSPRKPANDVVSALEFFVNGLFTSVQNFFSNSNKCSQNTIIQLVISSLFVFI